MSVSVVPVVDSEGDERTRGQLAQHSTLTGGTVMAFRALVLVLVGLGGAPRAPRSSRAKVRLLGGVRAAFRAVKASRAWVCVLVDVGRACGRRTVCEDARAHLGNLTK